MQETQIYSIVNAVASQTMGVSSLAVVDTAGLVSLGDTVLASNTATESFINTLVKRIGKVIISSRAYRNQFTGLIKDNFEWGAIVQKLKVEMPDAEADESYGLTDGTAVDHYVVAKPVVTQKLFITEAPYQFKITIQRVHLEEAFTSAEAMGGFISAIYGEVQNAIELALENLGRTTLNNMIAESSKAYNLVTLFNALGGTQVTAADCLYNDDFLRFAIATIKKVSKRFESMTKGEFNDGTTSRHTPKELQKLYVLTDLETALETEVQYAAFHEGYVALDGFEEVGYWQSIDTPAGINIQRASDGTATAISNVVACLFDRDALGTYRQKDWTATTPMNAAGGYVNTYWHEKQLWFNDLSENFVYFTLN